MKAEYGNSQSAEPPRSVSLQWVPFLRTGNKLSWICKGPGNP